MVELDRPPAVGEYPGKLKAFGDEDQLLVFVSSDVQAGDPILWPVEEHIERYGMVLDDEASAADARFESGHVTMRWYIPAAARRDGTASLGGSLQQMWDHQATRIVVDDVPRLFAQGDATHLVVVRSPLAGDDPSHHQVEDHIRTHGLVFLSESIQPARLPGYDFDTVQWEWYVSPGHLDQDPRQGDGHHHQEW